MKIVLSIFPLLLATAAAAAEPTLVERAEKAAAELPWYEPNAAVQDRVPDWGPQVERVFDPVARLQPTAADLPGAGRRGRGRGVPPAKWEPKDIHPLVIHKDPKVRTLGLMLLYDLQWLDVLPEIALNTRDEAATFPTPAMLANRPQDSGLANWPMEKKTVADYARLMIGQYQWMSAELIDIRVSDMEPQALAGRLAKFAAKRDPQLSTVGLRLAMKRAETSGQDRVKAVGSMLSVVPMPRQFFVALSWEQDVLANRDGKLPVFISLDRLLAMAREVPREVRLAAISLERPLAADPDLSPGFGARFFLTHAAELLLPRDVPRLLELESKFDKVQSRENEGAAERADYVMAAAKLQPERADELLSAAIARYTGQTERTTVATLLAQLCTERGQSDVVNWFFKEQPERGAYGFGREMFLTDLRAQNAVRFRKFVELIIRDRRLETLGPASTRQLVQAVSGYLGRWIVPEEQVQRSYGIDEAMRDGPFGPLPEWHKALRASVDEWSKAGK